MQQLQHQAVQAAKNQNWQEAVTLNQQIIQQKPDDIPALNRLGIALAQLKKTKEAKKVFQAALKIDPKNKIAKKNLHKLNKSQLVTPHLTTGSSFVEEPGKTKIIKLHRLADRKILSRLSPGNVCNLKVKKRFISVEVNGQYIGSLPEDISFRLTKLINTGNRYECYIQKADYNTCFVYLKETKQSKRNANVHSFPINGSTTTSGLEVKTEPEEMPIDIPFEVVNLENEDKTAPVVATDSTVIT